MGQGVRFEQFSRGKNEERKYIGQGIEEFNPKESESFFYETLKAGVDLKYQKDFNLKKVAGYFDPEKELSEILKIERGQKKDEALAFFKLKLAEQQKGLAILKGTLFAVVNKNEDSDKFGLLFDDIVSNYRDAYKFSPYQIEHIKAMISEFLKRHKTVDDFYKENNGDPEKMYKEIFKVKPDGQVEVKKGPISLAFICSNLIDYARLYNQDYSGRDGMYISEEKIDKANMSGGVFTYGAPITQEKLRYTIIGIKGNNWYKDKVIKHEEQHAIDRIYVNNIDAVEIKNLQLSLWNSSNLEEAEELVVAFCKDKIFEAGERVKDEILAYKIENDRKNIEILKTLTRTKQTNGLYDYFDVKELLYSVDTGLKRFKEREKVYKKAEEILIDKYRKFIQEGIFAFDILVAKGYKEQEVVSILMRERLDKWEKVADRMPFTGKENRTSVLVNSKINESDENSDVTFHGLNLDNSAMEEALRDAGLLKKKFNRN